MRALHAWTIVILGLLHYLLHRMRLARRPDLMRSREAFYVVIGHLLRWRKTLRVMHLERCPSDAACVFAQNHVFLLDPFVSFAAAFRARRIMPRFMSRDDFFAERKHTWWYRLVNVDELICELGTIEISRGNVSIGQLRPFVNVLRQGDSFIMYPGRTRSRSGLVFEYRDDVQEPGSASFFVAQAQRGREAGPDIAIVPLARTPNLATGKDTVVFGHPLRLPPKASREEQRALDFGLVAEIARNVTVNATQIVAGILYLRALHGLPDMLQRGALEETVRTVLDNIPDRTIEPETCEQLPRQLDAALQCFAKAGLLELSGASIRVDRAKVLATPPMDRTFRRVNPAKYSLNQILHFADITMILEDAVLGRRET